MKILHLSDLHFPTSLPFFQLKGKMFVGYLNYNLRRKNKYPRKVWDSILTFVQEINPDAIVVSGDLTNVSHEEEFKIAKKILNELPLKKVFYIPGNHDRYVKQSSGENALYEKYFSELSGESISYNKSYIRIKKIQNLHFVGWDSSIPLSVLNAHGRIHPEVVLQTKKFLSEKKITNYILVCHHPIWNPIDKQETVHHKLLNREEVASLLKERPPILYLHGHVHTNWVKFPGKELPYYVINSASSTRLPDAKHESGFHLIEIQKQKVKIQRYTYNLKRSKFTEAPLVSYSEKE
ncbi:metallophosphoesterase family protein [Leptospira kirschneri]|uniref:metallophosphoesterase family protein n=1 Tax=Leptospira kirschneri TaxID=29507 RepID=UPI000297B88E|nr:metallophosphoesterase family protein [Leptospira kirschneri]EKQ84269.1 calcineurin-like phosphoesterase family protein [Leptospira kirschneri serovar Grippotyphosa str. Moskva]EKR10090.1 calcineurin-like phosphoesterase family protein [Leptospira kirschneri serovar Valbuzzi str. 200702274]EMN27239.1 calcineurin-like phosphoesterase family protein [Leptospira kirschneri serovar Sokoine str. RM1]EPG50974.1 calcineurin-like phosphoesterase family protein [Leptospira kirschneri serovar Cynopter